MRKFELKKVKIHDDMSEETMCFSAELWVDGKHLADVSNRGHGGSNDFYVHKPFKYNDIAEFDTLDGEVAIFEEADRIDVLKKHQSKGIVLRKGSELSVVKFPIGITKWKKHPQYESWNNNVVEKYTAQGYEVLNKNL